ncbi:hypothetical protein BDA99DRAFT_548971 [Phascolomyces articulosus]|uniref:Uncharacterized protein n=1 Tax=Phascolomyces articulosus TaxID=60185 RepID=A0AAD5JZ80_9FUNG|nr:hypothetical protein BDA99DRAFT_548971 [Phascolomyces articulosus]
MKLYNKMHIGDCLAMDGGYNLYINKFKEESLNKGKDFSDKNFVYPIIIKTFNIITQEHHKLWVENNFEFPTDNKLIDIVLNNEIKQMEKIKYISEIQKSFDDLHINDNEMMIDNDVLNNSENAADNNSETEEVDFPEYKNINKKKRKKGKSARKININLIRDINKNNNFYEIENILEHKLNDNDYIFLVNEKDFNEKDLIKKYLMKNNIRF